MEPVRGLSIVGSCAAIPVGVKRLFVANILTGKPVSFLWTFDMHRLKQTSHMGKEVSSGFQPSGGMMRYRSSHANTLKSVN